MSLFAQDWGLEEKTEPLMWLLSTWEALLDLLYPSNQHIKTNYYRNNYHLYFHNYFCLEIFLSI